VGTALMIVAELSKKFERIRIEDRDAVVADIGDIKIFAVWGELEVVRVGQVGRACAQKLHTDFLCMRLNGEKQQYQKNR